MDLTPKVLENPFVRLEPLEERHREPLQAVAKDPEIWSHMSERGDGPHFDDWFGRRFGEQKDGSFIGHAVILPSTGECVGHTSFLAISPVHSRVEIGWTFYAADHRGTAVNPAAKLLMIGRAIDAGAARIELKTGGENRRSQRAMEKLGLTREGVLRSHIVTWTGKRRDSVYYSLLPEEWPAIRTQLEKRLGIK